MAENLRRVAAEIVALQRRPAGAFINGDCAFGVGTTGDYTTLGSLLKPFPTAGIPLHLGMGNHDHRENFRAGLPDGLSSRSVLEGRQVSLVQSRRANWFLLDTLDQTNKIPGRLGDEQRKWLAEALDARTDRPALVVCHHNPQFQAAGNASGLLDTAELMTLLGARKHVKALIFGHTHHWSVEEREGLYLINLPPVAYVFQAADPSGWVDVHLNEHGATLELRSLDPGHAAHAKKTDLRWRKG